MTAGENRTETRRNAPPRWHGWTLRRRLLALFVGGGVLLVIGLALSAAMFDRVFAAQHRLSDLVTPVDVASGNYFSALLDEETGVRGFALAGNEEYLSPYNSGRELQERSAAKVTDLLQDDPTALALFETLEGRVNAWSTQYAEPTIATVRGGAVGQTPDQIAAGKRLFDGIRESYAHYQDRLEELRVDGRQDLRQAMWVLIGVLAIGGALAIVIGTFGQWALRRWVTEPVEHIARAARFVASGELTHPITPVGPPELTALSADVESMRAGLSRLLAEADTARRELDEQAAELARSNSDLEQFAYVASHDLQEPLRKVASFCQLLERRYKGKLDDRADQYIEFAVDGAKRMQQLINDLLTFSRVGRATGDLGATDMAKCLASATRNLQTAIDESGATIEAGELPTVRGEPVLVTQLLQNLVGNAIKFRGEAVPHVRISARRDGAMWEFACADNGIGIEPQYAERIFVIFQRLHAKGTYQGTGIGLALCKKIVEYLGGEIWLDADGGPGTTFRWTLPAVPEPVDLAPADRDPADRDPADREVIEGAAHESERQADRGSAHRG